MRLSGLSLKLLIVRISPMLSCEMYYPNVDNRSAVIEYVT
jgi:hypothetical protein